MVAGLFTWTALNRKQKLTVLKELPQKLPEVLPEEDAIQIGTLWNASSISNIHVHCIPLHVIYHVKFAEIYGDICSESTSADEVHSKVSIA